MVRRRRSAPLWTLRSNSSDCTDASSRGSSVGRDRKVTHLNICHFNAAAPKFKKSSGLIGDFEEETETSIGNIFGCNTLLLMYFLSPLASKL